MLELTLLGEITIRWHGEPITHFGRQKEVALLIYLAHTGQTHGREVLADLLWESSSTKQSLSNLRTIIARLRKQMGDQLIITRKTMAVTTAVHQQTDSVRFQSLLTAVDDPHSVNATRQLSAGLALYRGELMAGFYLSDAPRFNDWLVVEQEHLRQIALRGYQQLASWQEEQGDFTAGVNTAQQWLNWDPFDEIAQQQLMRHLTFAGRISEALSVYEKCQQLLQSELGISPSPATVALHDAIQAGSLQPPASSTAIMHNLPRVLMPRYGRQKELAHLNQLLLNSDYPLIAITGVGGIGKTTLALAAGRQLVGAEQNPFKDGIWFVALEEIENEAKEKVGNRVAALVEQAIGLYFHGEGDPWSQLLGELAGKNLLLILDNIEQFLPIASELIVELLQASESIQLLVTSRTTVPSASCVAFPLTGIEIPAQVSLEALQNDSVRLFAERAGRTKRPFHIEEHLAEVVAICQFVEGLPLGIELAAASSSRLMIAEIVPALANNLQLIETNQRDLPPRQRTLQAVFDYSWQLLTSEEQRVLAQISIFRNGFTRQAAEAVLQNEISNLYNLLDHSLLTRNELGRFRMHPLLRQLAREKLSDPTLTDLAKQTLQRHSRYFAEFMHSFEHDLQLGVSQAALQTILPEQANLRAAWQYAVQTGQWQIVANCLDGLHFFYKRTGLFSEEAVLVDSAITTLEATKDVADIPLTSLLSRLLTARAWTHLKSAEYEIGLKTAERACELAQKVNNVDIEAQARLVCAKLLAQQHSRKLALNQYEQVVALAKTTQNEILEANGWIGIGEQTIWQAGAKLAQEPLQNALSLCQKLQYRLGEMETLIFLGFSASSQGAYAESIEYEKRSLQISRLLGDVAAEAVALGSLSVGFTALGDLVGSQSYGEEALSIFRQLNMPESEEWILGQLGLTAIQLGDYATAEKQLTNALAITQQLRDTFWQAWVKLRLGAMWNARGESEKALLFITEAFQTVEQLQQIPLQARVLYDWGDVLLNQADWANAELKFQKAHDLWQERGKIEYAMLALAGLAYVAYQQEMPTTAAAHAEQLWQIWQAEPSWAERADLKVYWMLGMVWDGLEDSQAKDLWQKAQALLQKRSEKIPDQAARQMFLEDVPAHRAILKIPNN